MPREYASGMAGFVQAFENFLPDKPGRAGDEHLHSSRTYVLSCEASVQFRKFRPHQIDQRLHRGLAEFKPTTSRAEEFRQRTRTAQCERAFVIVQRLCFVAFGIRPDLESAELGDAVFDVIKRVYENVKLPVPQVPPRIV